MKQAKNYPLFLLCLIILHAGEAWPVSFSNTLGHKRGLCETKGFASANKSKGESLEERLGYSFSKSRFKKSGLSSKQHQK